MWHDGCSDDADGDSHGCGIWHRRQNNAEGCFSPGNRRKSHFNQIAKSDDSYEGANNELNRPKATIVEQQYAVGQ